VFDAGSVTDLAHQLGYFATIASWRDWTTIGERLAAVTPEAIHAAARKYLVADNRTIGIFEPTTGESEAL
jgi:predicted Zn-dependent peptidase